MMNSSKTHDTAASTRDSLLQSARSTRYVASLLAGMSFAATASAADWTGNTSRDWNTGTNWSTNTVPAGENAVINDVTANVPLISADIAATPVDILVGTGAGGNGQVDHTAGTAQTGAPNWMLVGRAGGSGIYNLADPAGSGGEFTGMGPSTGTLNGGNRLYVGGSNLDNDGSSGTLNVNTSGSINFSGDLVIGSRGATGVMNMDAGAVTAGGWHYVGQFASAGGASGDGTLNISGGTYTQNGSRFYVGVGNAVGDLNMTGGSISVLGNNDNSLFGIGVGNLAHPETSSVTMSGGTINAIRRFSVGGMAGGNGDNNADFIGPGKGEMSMIAPSATLNVDGEFWVGEGTDSTGDFTLSAGTINITSWVAIGRSGGTGTFNMTGGTINRTANADPAFIIGASGPGTFNQDGGEINIDFGPVWFGEGNLCNYTLDSGAFNAGLIQVGRGGSSTGNVTLNGGTLTLNQLIGGAGVENVVFNGTQLVATGEQAAFLNDFDLGALTIEGGNLVVDSAGFSLGSDEEITGTGGVVKTGAGTLNLAGAANNLSYAGDNMISGGTLVLPTDPSGIGDSPGDISVADGAGLGVRLQTLDGQLSAGNVSFDGPTTGTSFSVQLGDLAGSLPSDPVLDAGGILTRNGDITVNLSGSRFPVGQIPLLSYDSTTNVGSGAFLSQPGTLPNGVVASIVDDPSFFGAGQGLVYLDVTSVSLPEWTGTDAIFTRTGDILDGDPVVLMNDISGINIGDTVSGEGIPDGTTVATLDTAGAGTGITLSQNATVNNPTAELVFASPPGSDDGEWDIASTANWIDQVSGDPSTYTDGAPALFSDKGIVTTVDLNTTVMPSELTFNHSSVDYTLTSSGGSGEISGGIGLLKQGEGTLSITGIDNTYDGVTRIEGGTLAVDELPNGGIAGPIGDSSADATNLVLAGGSLAYTGPTATTDRGFTVEAANVKVNVDAGTDLTLTGDINATSGHFDKTGGGNLIISGDITRQISADGWTEVDGGSLRLEGAGSQVTNIAGELQVGTLPDVPADFVVNAGELNVGSWISVGRGNGDSGTLSTFTATDSTVTAANFSTGFAAGLPNESEQTITLNDSTLTNNGQTNLAEGVNSTTTLDLNGTSEFSSAGPLLIGMADGASAEVLVNDSAQLLSGGNYLSVGQNGTGIGTVTVADNGVFNSDGGDFNLGDVGTSTGFLNIEGNGAVSSGGTVYIGKGAGCSGTLTQTGGSFDAAGLIILGRFGSTSNGQIDVSGGVFSTSTNVDNNDDFVIGEEGTGMLTISGSGIVDASGSDQVSLGQAGTGNGTINLNAGGLLIANQLIELGGGAGGSSTVNLDGGTLRASATIGDFLSVDTVAIGAGGGSLDTQGFEVITDQAISGTGDLAKLGTGLLQLDGGSSLSGTTTITAGTLGGNGSLAGPLAVEAGATLAPGASAGTFTAGDTTLAGDYAYEIDGAAGDSLVVNGNLDLTGGTLAITQLNPATAATYVVASYTGSLTGTFASVTGLPAGYTLDYGTGSNSQITLTNPNADPFLGWIDGFFPGETDPAIVGKDADPDGDGQSNLVEFALGGNPDAGGDNAKVYVFSEDSDDADTDAELLMTLAVRAGTPAFPAGSPASSVDYLGVSYTVEGSLDLVDFDQTVEPVAPVTTGLPPVPADYEYRTFSLNGSDGFPSLGFLRVEVTETP